MLMSWQVKEGKNKSQLFLKDVCFQRKKILNINNNNNNNKSKKKGNIYIKKSNCQLMLMSWQVKGAF